MTYREYRESQKYILWWQRLPVYKWYDERLLAGYLEALVSIKAHAWCLDVASERRAMAELMLEVLQEYRQRNI